MRLLFLILMLTISSLIHAQTDNNSRFIEVTGSAEKYVEPDEIRFHIGIEEYWKEEYEKGKEYKDYVTIVPLETIEEKVMLELKNVGIAKNQIIIKNVGNSWSRSGKAFKKSKLLELIITDFKVIDSITTNVNTKGINILRIAELKHKNIRQYRKDVKIEAMKAAKEKAMYLLQSVDENLGQIISVVELDDKSNFLWQPRNTAANVLMPSAETEGDKNIKKIKLKYEVKTRFAIE